MTERTIIAPAHMQGLVDAASYAPAVRVGDHLHVSGQVGRDLDMVPVTTSLEDHIVAVFENLRLVLEAAGGTLDDVYELVSYHVDIEAHMATFVEVKKRYFGDAATIPTWTAVGVPRLNHVDFLVEVSARALLEPRA